MQCTMSNLIRYYSLSPRVKMKVVTLRGYACQFAKQGRNWTVALLKVAVIPHTNLLRQRLKNRHERSNLSPVTTCRRRHNLKCIKNKNRMSFPNHDVFIKKSGNPLISSFPSHMLALTKIKRSFSFPNLLPYPLNFKLF